MKKALSIALALIICTGALCSCKNKKIDKKDSESELSSAVTVSENESNIESEEDKESEISKESSITSSKKTNPSVDRTESTASESVKKNVNPSDALSVGMFHFSPYWSKNYKEDIQNGLREFSDVIEAGYVNTVILSENELLRDDVWDVLIKNNVSVWLSCYGFLGLYEKDFERWMTPFRETLSEVKKHPERWNLFCGFVHEENIWRGQSNANFLKSTEALYREFGKRNFPVWATGEFTGYEGNQNQINMDASNMKKINPKALKYVTDTAFDSYSIDVLDNSHNGGYISDLQMTYPNIYNGRTYYIEFTKLMLKLFDHDVNVWFYPCGYTTGMWDFKSTHNEESCLGHLEFFDGLLKKQKFQGGLILYTYQQFSNPKELGLQSHLVVKNDEGKQELRPNEAKWEKYSERLKEICAEYKSTKAVHIAK